MKPASKTVSIIVTLLCGVWLSPTSSFSQVQVIGRILEAEQKGLPYANVLLLKAQDSSLVKGMVTDENGLYNLPDVKAGRYILAASMLGYQKGFSPAFVVSDTQSKLNLAPLTLSQTLSQLNEVKIEASRPLFEQQIDRLVVNVGSSITAAGSTALDVLERSPGVTVNRQNNELTLSGKNGVMVMINGKLNRLPMDALLQMLAGMNAGNIQKIELITNPSAQFDAEGEAGLINIVLKKNTSYGTNGNYNLSTGYGIHEKLGGALNLNHRQEKLNIFGDYAGTYDHHMQDYGSFRHFTDAGKTIKTQTNGSSNRYRQVHNARLGFDYNLNARTSFGGLIAGFSNYLSAEHKKNTNITRAGLLTDYLNAEQDEFDRWQHLMGNLNFRHTIAGKHKLNLDLDYLLYYNYSPDHHRFTHHSPATDEILAEQIKVEKNTPIQSWVLKGDYSVQINKDTKLDLGGKSTLFRLKNEITVTRAQPDNWQLDNEFSQYFNLNDDIQAAYFNVQHAFSPKIKLQSGLRYEYTHTLIQKPSGEVLVDRHYGRFFPSLFISKELNQQSSLQLSYSRRIQRPPYGVLAPFVNFVDPNMFTTGNPAVKPAFTDAFQASYRFHNDYLLTLKYSQDQNALNRFAVGFNQTENRIYYTPQNIRQVNSLALTFSFPQQITSWWQVQHNLLGTWKQAETLQEGENVQITWWGGSLNTSNTFRLPAGFTGEVIAIYALPSLYGLYQQRAKGSVNLGVQKKLSANKGSFSFSVTDVFWTNKTRVINDIPAMGLYAGWHAYLEPHVIRLTYSRNFGNQKVKAANKRTTGSEEERSRVN